MAAGSRTAGPAPVGETDRTAGAGARLCAAYREKALAESARRRALVLGQPDRAAWLTLPPLGYRDPWQWTGYVPGGTWGGGDNADQLNTSPRRRALIAVVEEAERHAAEAATATTGSTTATGTGAS